MVLSSDNGGYTKSLGPCTDGSDPVRGITCMSGEVRGTPLSRGFLVEKPRSFAKTGSGQTARKPQTTRRRWWRFWQAGANNYPLRGGKYSLFEGGIRANSFVSGGFLPPAVRGTVLHGLLHISDCALSGHTHTHTHCHPVSSRNVSFSAIHIKKRSFYQDRLRTNIGKVEKRGMHLSRHRSVCSLAALSALSVDRPTSQSPTPTHALPLPLLLSLRRVGDLLQSPGKETPFLRRFS
jgi:hypothetical protein